MTSKTDEEADVSDNSGGNDGWISGLGGSLEKQREDRRKELEKWQAQMGEPLSEIEIGTEDEETGETIGFWESNDGGLVAYRKMKCGYHHDYLFGYYSPEVIKVIFSLKAPKNLEDESNAEVNR